LNFTVILPPGAFDHDNAAAFDSDDSSDTQTEMDLDDDICRHNKVLVPGGFTLRVSLREDGTFLCHVCPGLAHRWRRLTKVRDHVVGQANTSALRGKNKKKYSRHRVLARNMGWMYGATHAVPNRSSPAPTISSSSSVQLLLHVCLDHPGASYFQFQVVVVVCRHRRRHRSGMPLLAKRL
jgi:hypothetical protein